MATIAVQALFELRRKNLNNYIKDNFEGNRSAFARKAGSHQNQINLILSDNLDHRRNMGEHLARTFEKEMGIEAGYFDKKHEKGDPSRLDNWDVPVEAHRIVRPSSICAEFVATESFMQQLKGLISSSFNLKLATLVSAEMSPEIETDSQLLLDTGVGSVTLDGVYVLERNGSYFLRRVSQQLSGGWTLQTGSKLDESVHLESLEGLCPVARVAVSWKMTVM